MPVLTQEVFVPNLFERINRTRFHVVLESERMSDFMGDDVTKQFPHEIVGKRKLSRSRVQRTNLKEVPVLLKILDVVIELDVRFENLTRSRVVNVGARRILGRRREPAHDGI